MSPSRKACLGGMRTLFTCTLVALTLTACEMFVGDFVERRDVPTDEIRMPCDEPLKCTGGKLERCTLVGERKTYTTVETCGVGLCNEELLMCMKCLPHTFGCQEEALFQCATDGSGWEPVEDCAARERRCDVDTGKCEVCITGDSKCEVVNGAHSRLECQATSGSVERAWNSTSCSAFACRTVDETTAYCEECSTVGDKRCSGVSGGPSNIVVECTSDYRWASTPCPQGVCEDGECVVPQ